MWDEQNDKKLREAAESFQPAPDESAWQKMEKLLDEELPQQKDRKRILFFLPVLLIVGGLLFFIFFYNNDIPNVKQPVPTPVSSTNNPATEKPTDNTTTASSDLPPGGNEKTIAAGEVTNYKAAVANKNRKTPDDFVSRDNENKNSNPVASSGEAENRDPDLVKNMERSKPTNLSDSFSENKDEIEANHPKPGDKQLADKDIPAATTASNQQDPAGKISKPKTKKKNSFADNFTLGFSAGPGISAVGSKEGKLTLDMGIAAGYRFSNHFGVRSAVFISKKIYSATPSEYTVPGGTSYNYLEKINANCNVIAIPLNLDYYFGEKRKHGWFASVGLSSYLMKKEKYDYVYKTPSGQRYSKYWTISNQNKHFFSVLDLSAGYQYRVNNRLSLSAQPYIDLPLTGIGAGKVKLFSEGILFTVKVKPFLKKGK